MGRPRRPRVPKFPSLKVQKAVFDAYYSAVGRVAVNCNQVQEALGTIFADVASPAPDKRVAFAVWYSSDSDRAQQRMLLDAVKVGGLDRWLKRPKAKDDLLWLLAEAGSLLDHRNNAIHAPISFFPGGGKGGSTIITPLAWPGHPRAKRLLDVGDLVEEFSWIAKWADVLTSFARTIWSALAASNNPWPDRPKRPARGPRTIHPGTARLRLP